MYMTFRLELAVCGICIWEMCISLKICVDITICLQIIYVSLQGPNITKLYVTVFLFFFSFRVSFPLIYLFHNESVQDIGF